MTDPLIRSAEAAARTWGIQVRAHQYQGVGGWPKRAPEQRAKEGDLDFSAIRAYRQHFDEALVGDALEVSRAIHRRPMMPEPLFVALFVRWVVEGKVDDKLQRAKWDRRSFFETLGRAHAFLAARLPPGIVVTRENLCAHESP